MITLDTFILNSQTLFSTNYRRIINRIIVVKIILPPTGDDVPNTDELRTTYLVVNALHSNNKRNEVEHFIYVRYVPIL